MDFRIKLGQNMKEIRQNARLSINQLAYFFEIQPQTLEEFERGNLEVPTLILSEYIDIKKDKGRKVREFIKQRRKSNV